MSEPAVMETPGNLFFFPKLKPRGKRPKKSSQYIIVIIYKDLTRDCNPEGGITWHVVFGFPLNQFIFMRSWRWGVHQNPAKDNAALQASVFSLLSVSCETKTNSNLTGGGQADLFFLKTHGQMVHLSFVTLQILTEAFI